VDRVGARRERRKKKLTAAAAEWVRSWSTSGPIELGREFEGPAWMQEDQEAEGADREFGILPDNWPAAQAFFACGTQWRADPNGGLMGLDYTALDVVLKHKRAPAGTFDLVRIMENAAIEAARRRTIKT
jgi:hypothetical protein